MNPDFPGAPELPEDTSNNAATDVASVKKSNKKLGHAKHLKIHTEPETVVSMPEDTVAVDEAAAETSSEEAVENLDPTEVLAVSRLDETIEDPATDRAVDDIVVKESDIVLAAEDRQLGSINTDILSSQETAAPRLDMEASANPHKHRFWLTNVFALWWFNPKVRWLTIIAVLMLAGIGAAVPWSRYGALNMVGVRSSINLSVIDGSTQLPLKNVQVAIHGIVGLTDGNGRVQLQNVELGPAELMVQKRAFESITKPVVLGWGSNPLGQFTVKAVGAQYSFLVTDYLSGKPLVGAEAVSGEGNAMADKDGKLVLTLDTAKRPDSDVLSIQLSAGSYRTETVTLTVNSKETQAVKMVPARKHVFISKRSGRYDIYTIDVDGKNEKKIVTATGLERDDITLIPFQGSDTAALVATRENVRDSDGYLLDTLYSVDLKDGTLLKLDQSEQIQIAGWTSSYRLVYVKIASGASTANPKRHRLMSFNGKNNADTKELASANAFNDVLMSGDRLYYAPSNAFQEDPHPGLYSVNADGSDVFQALDKETYNIFRTDYDSIQLSAQGGWFSYKLNTRTKALAGNAQADLHSRLYIDSIDKAHSLWIDARDGKGVPIIYGIPAKVDKIIAASRGIKSPAYWLNGHTIVYRVSDGTQVADYAVSTDGGEPVKIQDVTDSSGIDRWYYY